MIQGPLLAQYHPLPRGPRVCRARPPTEPTLVIVDDAETEGLAELLSGALLTHATAVRSAA